MRFVCLEENTLASIWRTKGRPKWMQSEQFKKLLHLPKRELTRIVAGKTGRNGRFGRWVDGFDIGVEGEESYQGRILDSRFVNLSVTRCCATNYPQTHWLKRINIYFLPGSVGQAFQRGLAEWFLLGVSHEISVKILAWAPVTEGLTGWRICFWAHPRCCWQKASVPP